VRVFHKDYLFLHNETPDKVKGDGDNPNKKFFIPKEFQRKADF